MRPEVAQRRAFPMACHEITAPSSEIARLFDGHRDLRVVIDGVLQGVLGRVFVDVRGESRAARLSIGVYEVFGGDPARGDELIANVPRPCELVLPANDQAWLTRARAFFGTDLSARSMRTFDASFIDPSELESMARSVPDGYRIEPATVALARRIGPSLAPNRIANFGDAESFVERGFGCCVLVGDDEIACAATTYARSRGAAEIAIATDARHRRRGLAVAAGAEMVRMCLERGCVPVWTAANDVSTRVAKTIGFKENGSCRIFDVVAIERESSARLGREHD